MACCVRMVFQKERCLLSIKRASFKPSMYRVNFPVYWVGEKAVSELNIYGIPMIMLVKDGEIVEKIVGKRSRRFLDKTIRNFLKRG